MKITIFPSKYHQNGGYSMAMLVYRSVTDCCTSVILQRRCFELRSTGSFQDDWKAGKASLIQAQHIWKETSYNIYTPWNKHDIAPEKWRLGRRSLSFWGKLIFRCKLAVIAPTAQMKISIIFCLWDAKTPLKINGWNIIMEVWFRSFSFLNGGDL